jgi:hypothetical protein
LKRIITIVLATAVGVVGLAASPAQAEERVCRGSIGAQTVDNLRVPRGETCTLNGTRVEGTVKIENRAKLRAENIRVIGNVQSEGHRRVVLLDSRVNGSVQLKQGKSLAVKRNVVGSDVQIFSNDAGSKAIEIKRNRIDGNLQCKSNTPRPTGGNNTVGGNKEDQCRRL